MKTLKKEIEEILEGHAHLICEGAGQEAIPKGLFDLVIFGIEKAIDKRLPEERELRKHAGHGNDDWTWCYVCDELADNEGEFRDDKLYNDAIKQTRERLGLNDKN